MTWCFCFCYSQNIIKGKVFTDTTMTATISGVKIIFKSESGKRLGCFKTDNKGFFHFTAKKYQKVNEIEITKKGYISLNLKFSTTNKKSQFYIKCMLKKIQSFHDIDYEEGNSKTLSIVKTE